MTEARIPWPGRGETMLSAVAALAFGLVMATGASGIASPAVAGACLAVALWAGGTRPAARSALLLAALLSAAVTLPLVWPLPLVAAVLVFTLLTTGWRPVRWEPRWWRPGAVNGRAWAAVAVVVAGSGAVLWLWYAAIGVRSGGQAVQREILQSYPWWVVVPSVAAFVLLNAAAEEAIFRGVLQQAMAETGPISLAVAVQALAFGLIHLYTGFPTGPLGMALAMLFGLILGVLRVRTGGLLAPWVAHVGTNLTMAGILAWTTS